MNAPLTVIAVIKGNKETEAELKRELLSLIAPSRKDAGCINYDLHQATQEPGWFMFHENWVSQAHLDQHLAKPDLQAVLARVGALVSEPPQITLWHKIA